MISRNKPEGSLHPLGIPHANNDSLQSKHSRKPSVVDTTDSSSSAFSRSCKYFLASDIVFLIGFLGRNQFYIFFARTQERQGVAKKNIKLIHVGLIV